VINFCNNNNINSQLDTTIANCIDNYNQLKMFRAIISPILRSTRLCLQLVVYCTGDAACWWQEWGGLSGMQEHMFLHTRQSSTQNDKYQVSHTHSCLYWWWAHSRRKHVEIDKYTKNKYTKHKLFIKLALFTRLYRDARSTKHKTCISVNLFISCSPLYLEVASSWFCFLQIVGTSRTLNGISTS